MPFPRAADNLQRLGALGGRDDRLAQHRQDPRAYVGRRRRALLRILQLLVVCGPQKRAPSAGTRCRVSPPTETARKHCHERVNDSRLFRKRRGRRFFVSPLRLNLRSGA